MCNEKAALEQKVEELEREVEAANKAARQSRANEVKTNRKLQELITSNKPKKNLRKSKPFAVAKNLILQLRKNCDDDEAVAEGVIKAICCTPGLKKFVTASLLQTKVGQKMKETIEKKMYQSIKNKFLPWVCLMHLDLAASVSFVAMK